MLFKFVSVIAGFIFQTSIAATVLDYKSAIQQCQSQLNIATQKNKSSLGLQLADLYLKDQDLEMAFRTFLKTLEWIEPLPEPIPTQEELKYYTDGMKIYLDHNGSTPGEIAIKLHDLLDPVLKEHSDYYLVNFLMAAAYANVGLFEEFFQSFYKSYQHYPHHYLAFKTQAVLHIKLHERVRTATEREEERKAIMSLVRKAVASNAKDTGLYKLLMVFASEQEKPLVVKDCLNKILEDPMILARGDIAFFVQQAVAVKQFDLAQQLINKAEELFTYSRVVIAAQGFLDQHRKGNPKDE